MTSINVRVIGTANVTQMTAGFGKVQAQVAALNTQLAQMVALQNGVDGQGFNNLARAAADNDKAFRSAIASTGMFEQQQLRLNSATDDYINKLKRQKMSFRDLMRERKVAAAAYKEQIAMENMVVRQGVQSSARGKQTLDVIYPRQVSAELDTAGRRLAFFNEQLKSGAHQMVNWGKNTQWAGRQLMVGFTMPIAAAGAAAGVLAYKLDQELTRIAKVYDTTANSNSTAISDQMAVETELAELRKAGMETALQSARAYGSAAQDTLNVQAELAATGLGGSELQAATTQVMRIARLGELDYQDALGTTISLQTVFRQNTDELAESFDYMNSIENATSLTTQDFAKAIPIAAAPIKAFGGDIKELGILLTAMRSRGIQATQGANAIKAAMQRLGRPSKQIQEEWAALTDTDITQIFEQSESLTEIFTKIRDATADLSRQDRTKAFAGLFGTYQVTRMSALVEGITDLGDATTQAGRAAEIAGQSSEQWAKTAQIEIDRLNESFSAQFKNALAEVQVQMSELGKPFVQIATLVLKGVSKIISAFIGLPDLAKWAIAGGIGLAAIAGPIVMLSGLFANLAGQFLGGASALTGLLTKMEILDKDSRAAKLAADLTTSGFVSQKTATQQLTAELNKMNLALMEAARLQGMAITPQRPALKTYPAPVDTGKVHGPEVPPGYYTNYHGAKVVDPKVKSQMEEDSKAARERIRQQDKLTQATEQETKSRRVGATAAKAAAASTGVMAASMTAMMFTSNETVGNIAQWAMIASIVVPAVKMLIPLLKSAAGWAATAAFAMQSGFLKATAGKGVAGAAMGLAGGAKAAAVSFATMMGPVGWITAALVAGGFALWKINKNAEEAAKKHLDQQKKLNSATDDYADSMGLARKEWDRIGVVGVGTVDQTKYQEQQKYFQEDETGIETATLFGEMEFDERNRYAAERYVELITVYGQSAEQASMQLSALWQVGTGNGIVESNRLAEQVVEKYGKLEDLDWKQIIGLSRERFSDAIGTDSPLEWLDPDEFKRIAEEEAPKVAAIFSHGLANASNKDEAKALVQEFSDAALQGFAEVDKGLQDSKLSNQWAELWKDQGIESVQEFSDWFSKQSEADFSVALADAGITQVDGAYIMDQLENAQASENSIVQAYAQQFLGLGDDVVRVSQLVDEFSIKMQTMTFDEGRKELKGMMEAATDLPGLDGLAATVSASFSGAIQGPKAELKELWAAADPKTVAATEEAIRAFAEAHNIKEGKSAIQTYYNILNGVKNTVKGTTGEIKSMVNAFKMSNTEANDMQRDAMSNVQQDMADAWREDFDDQMESALDAREQYWDRRQEAQENSFQRAQDALDEKWENKNDAAEKYWDNRVKRIQGAIEAEEKAEDKRQKMFDNEIARIKRLNDAMNRNIDFNVALNSGEFDEAAKIRNDVTAIASQSVLENAAAAGSSRTERRTGRLEGRIENVEEARDEYMDRLEKQEEAERRHLDKVQEMRGKALDREQDADMEAQREIWDNRKESLEDQLDLFLSYVARNEKDLKKHIKNVGLEYNRFGDRLMKRGDVWAKHFGDSMTKHLRRAGMEMQSDKMWEQLGKRSLKEILKGMGFTGGMSEFRKFINTGEMSPKAKGKKGVAGPSSGPRNLPEVRHEGGFIGSGAGSRKGVAKNYKGLHQSEKMVLAQKGEYVVNRTAAAKNAGLLESINSGSPVGHDGDGSGNVGGPGAAQSIVAMLAAAAGRGMTTGVGVAMNKAYDSKMAEVRAANSVSNYFGEMGDRNYSLPGVKPWVFEAAQYLGNKYNISSILGVGSRSNYSEHPLGRALDFMVSDDRGTALSEEVIRLAEPLDAMYLIWRQRIHSLDSRGWRPMEDRGSPTANHMDHVHVSFNSTGDTGDLPVLDRSGVGAGFSQGSGGRHRPVAGGSITQGLHYNNAVDVGVGTGTPVYSVADGRVAASYDIAGPLPTDSYRGDGPYGSYGRVIKISHGAFDTLYAHLSQRFAAVGQTVKGGAKIGLSGNTGNSSGSHLHFESHGVSPYAFLKKGGTIRYDDTPAILHKDERVLSAPLTSKLDAGIEAIYAAAKNRRTGGIQGEVVGPYNPNQKTKKKRAPYDYPDMITGMADSPHTWFDYEAIAGKKGKAAKKNSPTTAAADGSIRTGTYNVFHNSGNAGTQRDLKKLMPKTDILSLQEVSGHKDLLGQWLQEQNWGWLHQKPGTALAWNKGVLEMLKGGSEAISRTGDHRWATYGKFRGKEKGSKPFWQISAHTVAKPQDSAAGRRLQLEQYANLRDLWMRLNKDGAPVILSGDLNTSIARGDYIKRIGLGEGTNSGPATHGTSWLDHILFKGLKRQGEQQVVKGLSSDHNAVLSQFKVPEFARGGYTLSDGMAKLHKKELVLSEPLSKKMHEGVERFATGGDNQYTFIINGENHSADEIANKVMHKIKRENARKPGSRKNS